MHTAQLAKLAQLTANLQESESGNDQELLDMYNLIAVLLRKGVSGQHPIILNAFKHILAEQDMLSDSE